MSITASGAKKGVFNRSRMWLIFAGIAAVVAVLATFLVLSQATKTTTYYVLNQNIPARTLVTEEMVSPVTVSEGGQPRNAYNLGEITSSPLYSKFSLNSGDILTSSNSGDLDPINANLPTGFVVGSFSLNPSAAAAGKVQRGNYVDIYAISDDGSGLASHLFLQHVLVLDATIDLDSSSGSTSEDTTATGDASAAESSNVRTGIPTLYTVGLSQQDAAKLALATQGTLYLTLSSNQSADVEVGSVDVGSSQSSIISGSAGDSGAGTDPTLGRGTEETSSNGGSTTPNTSPSAPAPSSSPSN